MGSNSCTFVELITFMIMPVSQLIVARIKGVDLREFMKRRVIMANCACMI